MSWVVADAAHAAVLHTPPIGAGSALRCEVKNMGPAPAEVKIEVILTGGTLHVSNVATTIDPEESAVLVVTGSFSVCRFTVEGSKRRFLASACAIGGGCLAAQ